jgi:hypothetical protein
MFIRVVKWSALAAAVAVTVSLDAAQAPQAPAANAAPSSSPQLEQYKRNVGLEVDAMQENIQKWNDSVFSFAELGFQEFETSKYLTDILKQNGFTVEHGVAGIPTAWTAKWGSGKPVIALGSDIDDIPQASQKPGVAYHEPMIAGAPGHGEGHNSGDAAADRRGARREEGDGAAAPPGHADALAGRGGRARRHEGVLRACRVVQGRRHLDLHARRRQSGRHLGRWHAERSRVGRVQLQG